jgi:hypothetical protein
MSTPRNRVRSEVGKGVEALRFGQANLVDALAGSGTYIHVLGPWEVDVDVMDIEVTVGAAPAGTSNTVDLYKGTVSGAVKVCTQIDPDGFVLQVPTAVSVTAANRRIPAGTPVTVVGVFPGDNAAAPGSISVRVGVDIPVYDQNARAHTYGSYDDGI